VEDQLRVVFVEVFDDAAGLVAEFGEEAAHGVVGLVGGGEELFGAAEAFHFVDELSSQAALAEAGGDVEHRDPAVLVEAVFEHGVADDSSVIHADVALTLDDGVPDELAAVGGAFCDVVEGDEGVGVGGDCGTGGGGDLRHVTTFSKGMRGGQINIEGRDVIMRLAEWPSSRTYAISGGSARVPPPATEWSTMPLPHNR
jgi:hypothetical protein